MTHRSIIISTYKCDPLAMFLILMNLVMEHAWEERPEGRERGMFLAITS